MWIIFDVAIGMYKKKNTVNKKNFTRTSRFFSASWRNLSQPLYRLTIANLRFTVGTNLFAGWPDLYQLYLGSSLLWITGLFAERKKYSLSGHNTNRQDFCCSLCHFSSENQSWWILISMSTLIYLDPVMVVLLSKVTCVKRWIVLYGVWHASCQTSATVGCSPPPPVHIWSSVSHTESQLWLIIWPLFQPQIYTVIVKEAKWPAQKYLLPVYS